MGIFSKDTVIWVSSNNRKFISYLQMSSLFYSQTWKTWWNPV